MPNTETRKKSHIFLVSRSHSLWRACSTKHKSTFSFFISEIQLKYKNHSENIMYLSNSSNLIFNMPKQKQKENEHQQSNSRTSNNKYVKDICIMENRQSLKFKY